MRAAWVLLLLLLPSAQAHFPATAQENTDVESAQPVDIGVPLAVHADLKAAQPRYWRIDLAEGERVVVSLFVPPDVEGFRPRLVVLAPAPGPDPVPDVVRAPPGYGARVVEATGSGEVGFDPVVPSVYRTLLTVEVAARTRGTHYVAVFEYAAGPFGLAFGAGERAQFTDWAALPARRAAVYAWEGQGWWLAQGPAWAAGLLGASLLVWTWRGRPRPSPLEAAAGIGGILMLASSALLVAQLGWVLPRGQPGGSLLALSVLLALAPALLGLAALHLSRRDPATFTRGRRALLSLVGVAGFSAFAGFGLAPWVLLLSGLLPADRQ